MKRSGVFNLKGYVRGSDSLRQCVIEGSARSGHIVRLSRWLDLFFSSRRRHTRLQGDWSSDVCSSDLLARAREQLAQADEFDHVIVNDDLDRAVEELTGIVRRVLGSAATMRS